MKISMYKGNLEMPLVQVKPSEMAKMLKKMKHKDVEGYPQYFCLFPLPNSDDITFKIKD